MRAQPILAMITRTGVGAACTIRTGATHSARPTAPRLELGPAPVHGCTDTVRNSGAIDVPQLRELDLSPAPGSLPRRARHWVKSPAPYANGFARVPVSHVPGAVAATMALEVRPSSIATSTDLLSTGRPERNASCRPRRNQGSVSLKHACACGGW